MSWQMPNQQVKMIPKLDPDYASGRMETRMNKPVDHSQISGYA